MKLSKQNKKFRIKSRRGITDVISTMLLMAVTVTGASTLTFFMNDAFVSGNLSSVTTLESSSLNLLLLAYDTRDSSTLLTIADVDNENIVNSFLCGSTCGTNVNRIPESGGTEFIVIQLQNNGIESIFLQNVMVNGVNHEWDPGTSGIQLDTSVDDLIGPDRSYPSDGMFSILPITSSPITQNENVEISSGQIVNVLIKLGSQDSDIQINKGIQLMLNTGGIQPVEFLIESGNAQ